MATQTRIAVIGLGNMGLPMAKNLLKAGHRVIGFDTMPRQLEAAQQAGTDIAASPAEAVRAAEIVITMLPAGPHVKLVYLGERGIIAAARRGTLLIDCSTIDVESAREVAKAASEAGLHMLDAPVSGGVGGAEAGTLTFMVGGPDPAFARARPIFEQMGKTIVHAGAAGNGQAAKICNNMMLGIQMISVCEAFALADRLGLDRQKLFEISSKSSGQCWSLTTYCPVPGPVPTSPANRDYQAGFTSEMMLKDLRLSQQAAASAGAPTPLGGAATALYTLHVGQGESGSDFSGIFKLFRQNSP
jgi:3-hydroxyisobutyrate dehydrogenase